MIGTRRSLWIAEPRLDGNLEYGYSLSTTEVLGMFPAPKATVGETQSANPTIRRGSRYPILADDVCDEVTFVDENYDYSQWGMRSDRDEMARRGRRMLFRSFGLPAARDSSSLAGSLSWDPC